MLICLGRYEFHYDVSDSPATYGTPPAQFGAWEKRSGYSTQVSQIWSFDFWMKPSHILRPVSTQGSYTVKLPDGRTQIVTYTVADDDSGFVAEVIFM